MVGLGLGDQSFTNWGFSNLATSGRLPYYAFQAAIKCAIYTFVVHQNLPNTAFLRPLVARKLGKKANKMGIASGREGGVTLQWEQEGQKVGGMRQEE